MLRVMICTKNNPLLAKLPASDETMMIEPVNGEPLIWLDLYQPTQEEIERLEQTFQLHRLVVEDLMRPYQRAKIDTYDQYYFMVFYDVDYIEDGDLLDEHQLGIVISKQFLITVHHEAIEEIAQVDARFRRNSREIERGIGVLLYSLLDAIIDHYFPVLDRIGERISTLEVNVLEASDGVRRKDMQQIFSMKRELIDLRRQIAPQRDALAILTRHEISILTEATGIYMQDLYEHVLRVTDTIDVYRDLLSGILDAYLSSNSNQLAIAANNLNLVMKRLTSFSIILMSVTLIAGIYGMNFKWMPELEWAYGYPFALGLMLVVATTITAILKWKDWF